MVASSTEGKTKKISRKELIENDVNELLLLLLFTDIFVIPVCIENVDNFKKDDNMVLLNMMDIFIYDQQFVVPFTFNLTETDK